MSDIGAMLAESAGKIFERWLDPAAIRRARNGEWLGDAWSRVEEMGLPLALVPEGAGGFGVATADALALVRMAGATGSPLPVGETMVVNRAFAEAGLALAEGPAALVPAGAGIELRRDGQGWRLAGEVNRVAEGRHISTLAVETQDPEGAVRLVRIAAAQCEVTGHATNVAGMARDTLAFDVSVPDEDIANIPHPRLRIEGAGLRALQIAGALERVLELAIAHVGDRVQFGRTLSKFQVVQHEVARLAAQVAAARGAADLAADVLASGRAGRELGVAVARVRGGEAVGIVNGIAHQLHGAIGFTAEHDLHLFTTAAWAWRDEFGAHRAWVDALGAAALTGGPDAFWPLVTDI